MQRCRGPEEPGKSQPPRAVWLQRSKRTVLQAPAYAQAEPLPCSVSLTSRESLALMTGVAAMERNRTP